jgi:hypothetical protein
MANHIAAQFDHLPAAEAAESVATHLRSFWMEAMRVELAAGQADVCAGEAPHPVLAPVVRRLEGEP